MKNKPKNLELKEGLVLHPKDVESARHKFRRIIGVVGERIFYSVGGDKNFHCTEKTFRRWIGE